MTKIKKTSIILLAVFCLLSAISFFGTENVKAASYKLIENGFMSVEADSEFSPSTNPASNLIDYGLEIRPEEGFTGPNDRTWWSEARASSEAGNWYATIILDLGQECDVARVAITPVLWRTPEYVDKGWTDACPRKFVAYTSLNGTTWSSGSVKDNINPASISVNQFDPNKAYASDITLDISQVKTRYIKFEVYSAIDATSEGSETGGASLIKLANVKAFSYSESGGSSSGISGGITGTGETAVEVFASSENTLNAAVAGEYSPSHLIDGELEDDKVNREEKVKLWCSEWFNTTSASTDEFIDIIPANGGVLAFTEIVLYGNHFNSGFPVEIEFQYSFDGLQYVTAQTFKDITNAEAKADYDAWDKISSDRFEDCKNYRPNVFKFDEPIICDAFRIQFKKKGADVNGNYIITIAELQVERSVATAAEIEEAKAKYTKILEGLSVGSGITDDTKKILAMIGGSAGILAVAVAFFFIPIGKKVERPLGPDGKPIKRIRKTKQEKENELIRIIFGDDWNNRNSVYKASCEIKPKEKIEKKDVLDSVAEKSNVQIESQTDNTLNEPAKTDIDNGVQSESEAGITKITITNTPKKTFEESLKELDAEQTEWYNQILKYALSKKDTRESISKYATTICCGKMRLMQIVFHRGKIVCKFMVSNAQLKKYAKAKGTVKVKENPMDVEITTLESVSVAKEFIDVSHENIQIARNKKTEKESK
ncbi:MAG: discoidin domain-containing protein [Clostridiales bacterium]|nr:discoidin domain-containing protein [Clostridiales bacterium]